MNRRQFLCTSATVAAGLPSASLLAANESTTNQAKGLVIARTRLTPPKRGSIPVAILISESLNVIDFSGPWGVFESVSLPSAMQSPFRLFTVAVKAETVVSGSGL